MIRAILTSGSMRSLRHKPDRSCAPKPGHISCHRQPLAGRTRLNASGARVDPLAKAAPSHLVEAPAVPSSPLTPRSANPRQPGSAQSGPSVPRRLLLFALALTRPMLAFAGFLLWQFARSERDRMEMVPTARRVAGAVDRELSGLV